MNQNPKHSNQKSENQINMKTLKYIMSIAVLCLATYCGSVNAQDKHNKKGGDQHNHDHGEEVTLGKHKLGDLEVTAAQGHGNVKAGKEGHIVIKLPYKDKGQTQVRVWIGTKDRTLSTVSKAKYAPSHDDYDVHVIAPSPLPKDCKWWIELRKPDGKRIIGSIPLLKDFKKDTSKKEKRNNSFGN